MTDVSARLLVDLARRGGRRHPGTLRFEGAGLSRAGAVETGSGDPVATVVVHDPRAWSAVLRRARSGWRTATAQAGGTPTTSPTLCASPTAGPRRCGSSRMRRRVGPVRCWRG